MVELPERVRATLEALKREYGTYLEIKPVNKRYSVFEATSRYDPSIGRSRKVTHYLGWITADGVMVPARHRQPKLQDVARAIAREEAVQKMNLQELEQDTGEQRQAANRYENAILMNLSMNGRISHKTIAQRIGLKPTAAEYQIRKVEQKYGVSYLAEIDVNKLGYLEFVMLIKFEGARPSNENIRETLAKNPMVQMCATLKGEYDLLIYALAESDFKIADERLENFRSTTFTGYPAEWHIKLAYTRYGDMPLRAEFFELLGQKVWHRAKDRPRPKPGELTQRDFIVLKDLAANGTSQFINIDAKNGLAKGGAQYTYYRLLERGIVKRITINMRAAPFKSIGVVFSKRVLLSEFEKTRAKLRKSVIEYPDHPTNKYSLIMDIWDPDGGIRIAPLYRGESVDQLVEGLGSLARGVEFTGSLVSEILIGELCHRRFDNSYTTHYESLVKSGDMSYEQPLTYK
ncbi:MAG TPA: Lrp/AsnC family transcriptional regulator [Candidatus Acidoferrales bacterium]|nr:Lrp/AsnC family transcriptional regulator [Candidatus Acidoferrales bacterium]